MVKPQQSTILKFISAFDKYGSTVGLKFDGAYNINH